MSTARPVVVIAFGASSRATAAAGPVVSIKALTESLADSYDFRILAKSGIGLGDRVESPRGWRQLIRYFRETPHDIVMLSSFFDREYTLPVLMLRRFGLVPRRPTIVSPRGEFWPGALMMKGRSKRAYFQVARRLGLLDDVWIHATGRDEAEYVEQSFPYSRGVLVAPNVRVLKPEPSNAYAASGTLRLVFLSRIDRKKNLAFALERLAGVPFPVEFDIIGPVTHQDYWEECQRLAASLPSNIVVRHLGEIPSDAVLETLARYDLFYLPTLGENFGHAIFDALEAGLPVLLSDRTPWRNLQEREAGWDLPLDEPDAFGAALAQMAAASPKERMQMRRGARKLAATAAATADAARSTREMFRTVLAPT